MLLYEHVQDVAKLLDKIEASVEKDLMAPALPVTSSETLPAATTLGMAYDDSCVVSRVLIGGPAFLSGKIAEGDTLLAINGVSLTGIYGSLDEDAIVKLLVGDDIPGSECQVCFEKAVTGFNETVCLKRMPNDLLAHKRQMMSALESLRLRLKVKYNDSHSIKSLDIIMDLWRATIVSQHEHDQACRSLAAEIQQQTSGLLARLRSHLAETAKGSGTAAAADSSTDNVDDESWSSIKQWHAKSKELMDMIEVTVKKERIVPHLPVVAPDVVLPTATTLGLGYDDSCVVSRLLVGGPASLSGKIVEGDMLLAINRVPLRNNGMKLDDNAIVRLLVGSDVPGSECQVCVRACACFRVLFVCVCVCVCVRGVCFSSVHVSMRALVRVRIFEHTDVQVDFRSAESGSNETVTLKRMDNNLLAHKRQMMTALETLKLRFKARNDGEGVRLLDVVYDLWTRTIVAEHEADQVHQANVAAVERQLTSLVDEAHRELGCAAAGIANNRPHRVKLGAQAAAPSQADADDDVSDSGGFNTAQSLFQPGSEQEPTETEVRATILEAAISLRSNLPCRVQPCMAH